MDCKSGTVNDCNRAVKSPRWADEFGIGQTAIAQREVRVPPSRSQQAGGPAGQVAIEFRLKLEGGALSRPRQSAALESM